MDAAKAKSSLSSNGFVAAQSAAILSRRPDATASMLRRSTRCDRLPAFIERITVVGTIPASRWGNPVATVASILDS